MPVLRGLCPSGQIHYKRIGQVLTDARYDGRFPVGGLEDRGREYFSGSYYRWDTEVGPFEQRVLRRIVEETVQDYFDVDVHQSAEADMLRARREALNLLKDPAFVARALSK